MKKIILAGITAGLLISTAYAFPPIDIDHFATPLMCQPSYSGSHEWKSTYNADIIKLEYNDAAIRHPYSVEINVNETTPAPDALVPVGVWVKYCNEQNMVTRVNPGSSITCTLSKGNPVIIFSADAPIGGLSVGTAYSSGTYVLK